MIREALPTRRFIEHFDLDFHGMTYTIGVGYYLDGRPGEIFIDAGKAGTDLQDTAHDLAVAVSIALQHGAKLSDMRHTFARDEGGNPQGIMAAIFDHLALRATLEQAS
jgi:ribonucleoside-diphosphate reductase alpha chain